MNRIKHTGKQGNSISVIEEVSRLNAEVKRLKKEKAALEQNKHWMESLIDELPDAVYMKDKTGRLVQGNKAMAKLQGLVSKNDLKGRIDTYFSQNGHAKLERSEEKDLINNGKPVIGREEKTEGQDGHVSWSSITKKPMLTSDGKVIGMFGILKDITSIKKAYSKLDEGQQFIADVSHEMRNPLHEIMGLSRDLLGQDINGPNRKKVEMIARASKNLLVIINDILDFSKIKAKRLNFEHIGFNLQNIVEGLKTSYEPAAIEKGLQLKFFTDPRISKVLMGDPVRLNQILSNLLSNAIKFTPEGTVKLTCKLGENVQGRETISFAVADSGIGIKEPEKIFEAYEQDDKSITRKYGGTGLGLSICKELVALFEGTITVQSAPGKGAKFTVNIPFAAGKTDDLVDEFKPQDQYDTTFVGLRVLLVDDNEVNRYLGKSILTRWGAKVVYAHDGEECINALKKGKYHIVLMDIRMPKMDGIQATTYIRQHISQQLPIIALTGNVKPEEHQRCLSAGMNGILNKPFDPHVLYNTITRSIQKSKAQNISLEATLPAGSNSKLYNMSKVNLMAKGNEEFIADLIEIYQKQTPILLEKLRRNLEKEDFEKLSHFAHKLKSMIELFQIKELHPIVYCLEHIPEEYNKTQLKEQINLLQNTLDKVAHQLQFELVP